VWAPRLRPRIARQGWAPYISEGARRFSIRASSAGPIPYHWNTDNPHVDLIVRGADDRGDMLVIYRDYISHAMRERAADSDRTAGPPRARGMPCAPLQLRFVPTADLCRRLA
jgi:hypothetical protein